MDYLSEVFQKITESHLTLILMVYPAIASGVCRWIDMVATEHRDGTKVLFLAPQLLAIGILSWTKQWEAIVLAVLLIGAGKILIPALLDLFWNSYHFRNPFESFFLSEKRTMGPSKRLLIEQNISRNGIGFTFEVPPKNTAPNFLNKRYWSMKEGEIRISKFQEETLKIENWCQYNWTKHVRRGYLYDSQKEQYPAVLTIKEFTFFNREKAPQLQDLDRILSEIVVERYPADRIADGELSVSLNNADSESHHRSDRLQIHLNCHSWADDLSLQVIVLPFSKRRYITFCLENYFSEDSYIFNRVLKSQQNTPATSLPELGIEIQTYTPDIAALNRSIVELAQKYAKRSERIEQLQEERELKSFKREMDAFAVAGLQRQ